jgi:hypothetical protein
MINSQQYKRTRMESRKNRLIKKTQKNKMQATLARLQISRAGSCNWDKLLESKTRNDEVLLKKSILKDEIKKKI